MLGMCDFTGTGFGDMFGAIHLAKLAVGYWAIEPIGARMSGRAAGVINLLSRKAVSRNERPN
jgi:hypothetical protein